MTRGLKLVSVRNVQTETHVTENKLMCFYIKSINIYK